MKYYNNKTSDDLGEPLIEVDENDVEIGPVDRKSCHNQTRKPWHRTSHVYLFNTKGEIYLTQRSFTKDTAAGQWTMSAGGHVKYGNEPIDTAIRELQEELNVVAKVEFVDKIMVDYGFEKEAMYIFLAVTDDEPIFDPTEVEQVRAYELSEAIEAFNSWKSQLSGGFLHSFQHLIDTGRIFEFQKRIMDPNL